MARAQERHQAEPSKLMRALTWTLCITGFLLLYYSINARDSRPDDSEITYGPSVSKQIQRLADTLDGVEARIERLMASQDLGATTLNDERATQPTQIPTLECNEVTAALSDLRELLNEQWALALASAGVPEHSGLQIPKNSSALAQLVHELGHQTDQAHSKLFMWTPFQFWQTYGTPDYQTNRTDGWSFYYELSPELSGSASDVLRIDFLNGVFAGARLT